MLAIRPEAVNIIAPLINGEKLGLSNPIRVTYKSPKSHRKAVYQIAKCFNQELELGVLYGYDGEDDDKDHVAFLWIHEEAFHHSKEFKIPCIGACCFRLRESGYGLQWIWIHPYYRRQGLLSSKWDNFIKEFGDFEVEKPISEAMKGFLRKQNND